MITVLDEMHPGLLARAARDAIPMKCSCSAAEFAWPASNGSKVICQNCGATETVDFAPDPAGMAAIVAAQKDAEKV